MVKKIKRWYENLLNYQKQKIFSFCLAILVYILQIILTLLRYINNTFYKEFNYSLIGLFFDCLLIFIWIPIAIYYFLTNILFHTSDAEISLILKKMYEESEKEVKSYFYQTKSNIIEIVPKDLKKISYIVDYYYKKGKIIESYWAELDERSEKSVCYISVICKGETERDTFPEVIENFGYLLDNFTFKNN